MPYTELSVADFRARVVPGALPLIVTGLALASPAARLGVRGRVGKLLTALKARDCCGGCFVSRPSAAQSEGDLVAGLWSVLRRTRHGATWDCTLIVPVARSGGLRCASFHSRRSTVQA